MRQDLGQGQVHTYVQGERYVTATRRREVSRITHDDPRCRVCAQVEPGMVRLGTDIPEPFRNPESGEDRNREFAPEPEGGPQGTHWYHGTKAAFDGPLREPARDTKGNSRAGEDWNTELGVHFSSLHRVAREGFADNDGGSPHSRVAHATLHMANPKHFANEDDLATHAADWAHGAGHRFLPENTQAHKAFYHHNMDFLEQADKRGRSYGHISDRMSGETREGISDLDQHGPQGAQLGIKRAWMDHHPERHEIVHGYRDHLREQGHDGVLYGNDFEEPRGHTSAIAFPSTPVKVDRWEHTHPSHPDFGKTAGARPLYHGTSRDFDQVRPSHEHGHETFEGMSSPEHGYATSDPQQAKTYSEISGMMHGGRPRVYEVRHLGQPHELEHDPGYDADVRSRAGFQVLREVPGHELERMPRQAAQEPRRCPCGVPVEYDPSDGWQHADGSISHDGSLAHYSVAELMDLGRLPSRLHATAVFAGFDEHERTPASPPGFRHHDPSTWGEDYTRHARARPDQVAVNHAHESVRQLHPGISASIGADRREGSEHVQRVLRTLGHPDAEHSFAMVHPKPEHRLSSPVYDGDGIPGVALHPRHWDVEHAAHEIGHIMHNHETGREPGTAMDDDQAHGPDFVRHFQNALGVTHPDAGDDLGEHYQHWRGAIDGLRREGRYTPPSQRLFGPTYGLDSRLWEGDQLKFPIRLDIVATFADFCGAHGYVGWNAWAKIVFFGSEASEWTAKNLHGNDDFDLSIGIDYPTFRAANPSFADLTDTEIADRFTQQMHAELNHPKKTFPGVEGSYDQTWFANIKGWDIAEMRPYAAYDVDAATWIVKPPRLPEWSVNSFPEGPGLAEEVRGIIEMAQGILKMPEPYRTQNGAALWEFVHSNRSDAFGPQGEGWWDSRNVVEKGLDQRGLMQGLFECHRRALEDPSSLNSPANWSNTPERAP